MYLFTIVVLTGAWFMFVVGVSTDPIKCYNIASYSIDIMYLTCGLYVSSHTMIALTLY